VGRDCRAKESFNMHFGRKLVQLLENHAIIIFTAALTLICLYGAMLTST
jgi:hypothetical protein